MRKIIIRFISVITIALLLVACQETYKSKFAGEIYFIHKYENDDDAYLDSTFNGDVIFFEAGKVLVIEIIDKEDLDKIINESDNPDMTKELIRHMLHHQDITEIYNPKYDKNTQEIKGTTLEGDELDKIIKVLSDTEVEFNEQVYTLVTDKSVIGYDFRKNKTE